MKDKKEIIIFGCSPQIDIIKNLIPDLQKKYITIGINNFPVHYPNVNYWAFLDLNVLTHTNVYKHHKEHQIILTDYSYKLSGMLDNFKHIETFFINTFADKLLTTKQVFEDSFVVSGCYITLTYLINWCYLNGYTDIYLVGHLLSSDWKYFSSNANDDLVQPSGWIDEIRDYVYDAAEYINIYQTDPMSDMKLPYRSVESLLLS